MNPDELKNHALFAGAVGAFTRLAVVKPKSLLLAVTNVVIGGSCSWFFSPVIVHYMPVSLTQSVLKDHINGAISFTVGFMSLWIISYLADLMNESKGNPIAVLLVIKNQIFNINKPQTKKTDETDTNAPNP